MKFKRETASKSRGNEMKIIIALEPGVAPQIVERIGDCPELNARWVNILAADLAWKKTV